MRKWFRDSFLKLIWHSEIGKQWYIGHGLKPDLEAEGWFDSVKAGMPIDSKGNPIPWFPYSATHFLSYRIKADMDVFEYGSGNSTLWWAKQVSSVISYEHDLIWFKSLSQLMPDNVQYVYCDLKGDSQYSRALLGYKNSFDIIVIDGRDRVNCALNSVGALSNEGVIIWDDSDRPRYKDGCSYLRSCGFRQLAFTGLGPINNYMWCTSIFYRDGNCLDI